MQISPITVHKHFTGKMLFFVLYRHEETRNAIDIKNGNFFFLFHSVIYSNIFPHKMMLNNYFDVSREIYAIINENEVKCKARRKLVSGN